MFETVFFACLIGVLIIPAVILTLEIIAEYLDYKDAKKDKFHLCHPNQHGIVGHYADPRRDGPEALLQLIKAPFNLKIRRDPLRFFTATPGVYSKGIVHGNEIDFSKFRFLPHKAKANKKGK